MDGVVEDTGLRVGLPWFNVLAMCRPARYPGAELWSPHLYNSDSHAFLFAFAEAISLFANISIPLSC